MGGRRPPAFVPKPPLRPPPLRVYFYWDCVLPPTEPGSEEREPIFPAPPVSRFMVLDFLVGKVHVAVPARRVLRDWGCGLFFSAGGGETEVMSRASVIVEKLWLKREGVEERES